jgi:hypothetical protein
VKRPFARRAVMTGRRLGDPVDIQGDPNARAVRGRLAAVSVRASVAAGAWVGFALGLVLGALVGAAAVWFAGAVLDWQRDLAFTFGVARRLLPFGDQLGLLRDVGARWWLVVPGAGVIVGAIGALVGALLGGILAAAYNRSPRHALVVVELPRQVSPAASVAAQRAELLASPGPAPEAAPNAPRQRDPSAAAAAPGSGSAPDPVLHSRLHGADREE